MSHQNNWRSALSKTATCMLAVTLLPAALCVPAQGQVMVKTFTYKTVDGLDIKLDLHRANDDELRPLIVWIHGGALIMGHRAGISGNVKRAALKQGYALVSIDYRLAPETKLPAIISDLEDAFAWIRQHGREKLKVDTEKIAVMGGSAGGYMTLTSGFRVDPPPTVLVSFWGYGDLVGDWYSKPSPHPRHNRVKVSEEDARRHVSGPPVSDSRLRKGNGGFFYAFCRQRGLWPLEVSGFDPHREPEKFNPFMPVKNVSRSYPPTLLIHGTLDTDVPYEQSVMMARELRKAGVNHELLEVENGEHGLSGGKPERINEVHARVWSFVNEHMGRDENN